MQNLLPSKLVILRKHCKLSQQDVADKLGLSVQQYMAYENGSMMFNADQFMTLSELFHVSMEDMLINSDEIPLPDIMGSSVEIPFIGQEAGIVPAMLVQKTGTIPVQRVEDDIVTQEIPVLKDDLDIDAGLEKTIVTKIVETMEIDREELKEADEKASVVHYSLDGEDEEDEEDNGDNQSKPKFLLFLVIAAILVAAGLILWMVFKGLGSGNYREAALSERNRLSAAEVFTIHLDDNQNVITHGQAISTGDFTDVIQVSARKNFAVGLKEDGTVVCTATIDACNVSKWKDIVMVAAGEKHTLGLKKDGTVECSGETSSCAVEKWKDIDAVYAGNGISVGVTSEGEVVSCGNNAPHSLASLTNVDSLAMGNSQVLVLYKNGACSSISLDGNTASNVQGWSNIKQVAVGKDFAVGLKSDGTLMVDAKDGNLKKELESWRNIRFIASHENYIVGFNTKGKMKGAGDNRYDQYVNTKDVEEEKDAEEEKKDNNTKQLESVTNITFTPNTRQLNVKWDTVPDADYYEISINIPGNYKVKSKTNSVTIDLNKLQDGTSYTVSVVAYSYKAEFEASESVSTNYTYHEVKKEEDEFTITVQYKDESGNLLANNSVHTLKKDTEYKIESPKIEGYTASREVVEGKITKDETIVVIYKSNHVHEYQEVSRREPSCIDGERTLQCSCGDAYTEPIPAVAGAHNWHENTQTSKAATCTEAGVTGYICIDCGGEKTEDIQALGHDYKDGKCTRCGEADPTPPAEEKKE
ncbi:MAG: helix-turn-helix domain-containing protein [Erysipelotrichaceae bacterium]|nr:helix-turn-helix domain-containing protein [Erysipelotrichaceae bacterium]